MPARSSSFCQDADGVSCLRPAPPEAFVFAQAIVSTSATGNQRKVVPSSFSALTALHGGARSSNESFDRNRTVVSCDARPDFRRSRQRDSSSGGNSPLCWPRTGQCGEMRCRHQQSQRLSASMQSLHIYGSWHEGVLAVRGGLSGADRLLCFAKASRSRTMAGVVSSRRPPGFPMSLAFGPARRRETSISFTWSLSFMPA
jgi:hypothetical protein